MTDMTGDPVANGHATPPGELPDGFRPDPGRAFGRALAETLAAMLSQLLPSAIAQALVAAQSQPGAPGQPLMCYRCAARMAAFRRDNADVIRFAWAQAREAAGLAEDDPRALEVDFQSFLPGSMKPDQDDPMNEGRWPVTFPEFTRGRNGGLCIFHVLEDWDEGASQRAVTAAAAAAMGQ